MNCAMVDKNSNQSKKPCEFLAATSQESGFRLTVSPEEPQDFLGGSTE